VCVSGFALTRVSSWAERVVNRVPNSDTVLSRATTRLVKCRFSISSLSSLSKLFLLMRLFLVAVSVHDCVPSLVSVE